MYLGGMTSSARFMVVGAIVIIGTRVKVSAPVVEFTTALQISQIFLKSIVFSCCKNVKKSVILVGVNSLTD